MTMVGKETNIPEFHRNVTIRKIVLGRTPQLENCLDSRLKQNSTPVKMVYLLSL